ncbi:hypothetical protein ACFPRL_23065 [Pseudoclavibacter helvolus]
MSLPCVQSSARGPRPPGVGVDAEGVRWEGPWARLRTFNRVAARLPSASTCVLLCKPSFRDGRLHMLNTWNEEEDVD